MSVIDLEAAVKFWEMREDVLFYIKSFQSDCELYQGTEGLVEDLKNLINKIESIDNKEK